MTYYQLVKALEALALKAGAASFWAGAKTANGLNYNEPFPMCEFFNTQPSQLLAGVVRYSIGMGFYGKDEHENAGYEGNDGADGSPDNTVQIQSDMDELTQRFELLLQEADGFELSGGPMSRTPTLRNGTKIGTGLFIDFTLDVVRVC
jgi:hypothetical protein